MALSACPASVFLNCTCYFYKESAFFFNNNEPRSCAIVKGAACKWKARQAGLLGPVSWDLPVGI